MKAFAIDFVRQIIIQTILKEHIENPSKYLGGNKQIALTSFYEHLASNEEIDRYVNTIRDLTEQQNRTGLIANGTILTPERPTMTNINNKVIIPLSFNCSFRTTLADRELVLETLDNSISVLKGRKQDIAEFDNGKLFTVGTLGNNSIGKPLICYGDYLGDFSANDLTYNINAKLDYLIENGFELKQYDNSLGLERYYYIKNTDNGKLSVIVLQDNEWVIIENNGQHPTIIFPPTHNSFDKYSVSLSFEVFDCSEPRTLNASDVCDLMYGGSATIISNGVMLGNMITKLGIKPHKLMGATPITFDDDYEWLEPLEITSGLNLSSIPNHLKSNNFLINNHNDGNTLSIQYSFIAEDFNSSGLLNDFYYLGRYGIIKSNKCSPNTIYKVNELVSIWGNIKNNEYLAKISGDIDIENTETDTMTIGLSFQIQGENN